MVIEAPPRPKLETADLLGVEILAPGKWNNRDYSSEELDAIVSAFPELKASGQVRPPGKLGHDPNQKLAQEDGFPAIGWVNNLYREGDKLLADFVKVPRSVADIIEAGGYDSVSSELYVNLELNDKVYPMVLKAVAFLGANLPAVKDIKSISDVAALYSEEALAGAVIVNAEYERTLADDTNAEDEALSELDGYMARLEDRIKGVSGARTLRTFLGTARKQLSDMKMRPAAVSNKEVEMDIKVIAGALGLPETATEATVLAELEKRKTPQLTETEVRELRDEVGSLRKDLAERDAAQAVAAALSAGKIVPAQKEWATSYALKDPEGFTSYIATAQRNPMLAGPVGSDGGAAGADVELTEAEKWAAKSIGLSEDKATEQKKRDLAGARV